jgi:hypothetical protein
MLRVNAKRRRTKQEILD